MLQAERLVRKTVPQNIIVMGRDSDEPAVSTAQERGWSILVGWEHGVPFRQRGKPPEKSAGPYCDTILLYAPGLDRMYGNSRERRMKRSLLVGQDYSDGGLYGAGAKTVDDGRARPLLDVDWYDEDAFLRALAKFFGSGTPPAAVEETANRLLRGLQTWTGEEVDLFNIAEYYNELDQESSLPRDIHSPQRSKLVWPGEGPPPPNPADFSSHPLRPVNLAARTPRTPNSPGSGPRTPRLRLRPFAQNGSVLQDHASIPPDKPRPRKSKLAPEEEEQEEEDDDDSGDEEEEEPSSKKETGAFGKKARRSYYDYGPASTFRLPHTTWERSLVEECFVPAEEPPPPHRTRKRKRHLSGAAQSRKRRGLQPWRRRRKGTAKPEGQPELERVERPASKVSNDITTDDDRGVVMLGDPGTSPDSSTPRLVRLYPFQHTLRLLHFSLQQSLPWLRHALDHWAQIMSDPAASGSAKEALVRDFATRTRRRDGFSQVGAALAQGTGGREVNPEKVRRVLVTFSFSASD